MCHWLCLCLAVRCALNAERRNLFIRAPPKIKKNKKKRNGHFFCCHFRPTYLPFGTNVAGVVLGRFD